MLQTTLTMLIGLAAAAFLLRRWMPTWRSLLRPAGSPPPASMGGHCGTPSVGTSSACSQGCGGCGQSKPPTKDHRLQRVRLMRRQQP